MSDAYLSNWLASQPCDDRNRFHEIALHEARVASEARQRRVAPARTAGLLDRARAALRGSAPIDRCDCPAAA